MSHTITQLPAPTYYLGKATSFPIWDNHPNPLAADPAYIAAAWECGFGNKDFLTRSECVAIRAKKGLRLPRWLMKDPARRLERGKYFCPEIISLSTIIAPKSASHMLYHELAASGGTSTNTTPAQSAAPQENTANG